MINNSSAFGWHQKCHVDNYLWYLKNEQHKMPVSESISGLLAPEE